MYDGGSYRDPEDSILSIRSSVYPDFNNQDEINDEYLMD